MTMTKDIIGFEGLYSVNMAGMVFSIKRGRFMKANKSGNGYLKVGLAKNKKPKLFPIHRLVATAFIPNPENKPQVNHINGDKTDNRVENLEWATSKENIQHSINVLKSWRFGEQRKESKLCDAHVREIRTLFKMGISQSKLGRTFGVAQRTIFMIVRNKTWKHVA